MYDLFSRQKRIIGLDNGDGGSGNNSSLNVISKL